MRRDSGKKKRRHALHLPECIRGKSREYRVPHGTTGGGGLVTA